MQKTSRAAVSSMICGAALFAVSINASAFRWSVSLAGTVQSVPDYITSVSVGDEASWDFIVDDSVFSGDIDFSGSTLSYTGNWRYHASAIVNGTVRLGDLIQLPYLPDYFTAAVGSTVQNDWTLHNSAGFPLAGPHDGITFSGDNVDDPMNPLLNVDGFSVFGIQADLVDPSQTALTNANLADAMLLGFAGLSSGSMEIDFATAESGGDPIGISLDEWSVVAVPIPPAAWLMVGALLALKGLRRRRF